MALSNVYLNILRLSCQVLSSHNEDDHRFEFLEPSVVGYSWCHEPCSYVATDGLKFQQLFGKLHAALQLHKNAQILSLRHDPTHRTLSHSKLNFLINYNEQGRYVKWSVSILFKSSHPFNTSSISGCFNCGDLHLLLITFQKPPM